MYETKTSQLIRAFKGHKSNALSVRFSPNGKYLFTGSTSLKIWKVSNTANDALCTINEHTGPVDSIDVSSNNKYFVTASSKEGCCRIFNLPVKPTAEKIRPIKTYKSPEAVYTAVFTHDGKHVVIGAGSRVTLWNVENCLIECTLFGHTGAVCCVSPSLDNRYVVSGSLDGHVIRWDTQTGKKKQKLKFGNRNGDSYFGNNRSCGGVAISPDNNFILATSPRNAKLKIWYANTSSLVGNLETSRIHFGSSSSNNNDHLVALVDSPRSIQTMDMSSLISWCAVKPVVMLRWLYEKKRLFIPVSLLDATELGKLLNGEAEAAHETGALSDATCLFILYANDDVFTHALSFLFARM